MRRALTPACGGQLAERSIRVAAARVCQETGEVTHENWPAFIAHLRSIVGSVCGLTVGRLIDHVASQMECEAA